MADGFSVQFTYTEAELQRIEAIRGQRQDMEAPRPGLFREAAEGFAVALGGAALAVASGAVASRSGGVVAALLFLAFVAGAWSAYRRVWREHAAGVAAARETSILLHIELLPAGVALRTANSDVLTRWGGFKEAWVQADLLWLMADAAKGYVIPLRAFASPDEAAGALAYAHERIAARA